MAKNLSNIVQYPLIFRQYKSEMKILDQFGKNLSQQRLQAILGAESMDGSSSIFTDFPGLRRNHNEMTKSEFTLLVLHLMNKVDDKHLAIISSMYDLLDINKRGVLNIETFHTLSQLVPSEEAIQLRAEQDKMNRIRKYLHSLHFLYPSQTHEDIARLSVDSSNNINFRSTNFGAENANDYYSVATGEVNERDNMKTPLVEYHPSS